MNARTSIRTLLTVLVYSVAIYVGSVGLLPDPTSVWVLVPIASGTLLLAHAVTSESLDELGYAIMGMYATLLVTSVSLGAIEAMVTGQNDLSTASTGWVVALGLTAVLVGGYVLATRHVSDEKTGDSSA